MGRLNAAEGVTHHAAGSHWLIVLERHLHGVCK